MVTANLDVINERVKLSIRVLHFSGKVKQDLRFRGGTWKIGVYAVLSYSTFLLPRMAPTTRALEGGNR